jgi:hypothetical protein
MRIEYGNVQAALSYFVSSLNIPVALQGDYQIERRVKKGYRVIKAELDGFESYPFGESYRPAREMHNTLRDAGEGIRHYRRIAR